MVEIKNLRNGQLLNDYSVKSSKSAYNHLLKKVIADNVAHDLDCDDSRKLSIQLHPIEHTGKDVILDKFTKGRIISAQRKFFS